MADGKVRFNGGDVRTVDPGDNGTPTLGVSLVGGGAGTPATVRIDQTTPGATDRVTVGGLLRSARATFTRPSDATPYDANDAVANSTSAPAALTFAALARENAGTGYIVAAEVSHEKTGVTPHLRLHLFNTSPTAINDNSALALTYAVVTLASYLGYIDFEAMNSAAGSDYSKAQNITIRLPFVTGAASTALYGLLQTLDAFTPGNAKGVTVKLWADAN